MAHSSLDFAILAEEALVERLRRANEVSQAPSGLRDEREEFRKKEERLAEQNRCNFQPCEVTFSTFSYNQFKSEFEPCEGAPVHHQTGEFRKQEGRHGRCMSKCCEGLSFDTLRNVLRQKDEMRLDLNKCVIEPGGRYLNAFRETYRQEVEMLADASRCVFHSSACFL